jgi:hypothetical protein
MLFPPFFSAAKILQQTVAQETQNGRHFRTSRGAIVVTEAKSPEIWGQRGRQSLQPIRVGSGACSSIIFPPQPHRRSQ